MEERRDQSSSLWPLQCIELFNLVFFYFRLLCRGNQWDVQALGTNLLEKANLSLNSELHAPEGDYTMVYAAPGLLGAIHSTRKLLLLLSGEARKVGRKGKRGGGGR